ncbi:MAG: hypothetical protein LDL26_00010 [Caenispirillum bisanense]|nr:hypothetical protein [Caenispirillum bisanense]MCA1971252.1 hypothetical protein [Caenispirillum sp.]
MENSRARRRRREQFLAAHPVCCFCGGTTTATTEDHQPARTFFWERVWPEGYSFPACGRCNGLSRQDEHLSSLVAMIYPDAEPGIQAAEMRARFKGVNNNFPGLLGRMRPTARDVRRFLAARDIRKPLDVATSEVRIVNVDLPEIDRAVMRTGAKLTFALYYKHTGKIIGEDGGVSVKWFSNVQIVEGDFPHELKPVLQYGGTPERGKVDLSDQFSYWYVLTEDGEHAAFVMFFRKSFSIVSIASQRRSFFEAVPEDAVFGPLSQWDRDAPISAKASGALG